MKLAAAATAHRQSPLPPKPAAVPDEKAKKKLVPPAAESFPLRFLQLYPAVLSSTMS